MFFDVTPETSHKLRLQAELKAASRIQAPEPSGQVLFERRLENVWWYNRDLILVGFQHNWQLGSLTARDLMGFNIGNTVTKNGAEMKV